MEKENFIKLREAFATFPYKLPIYAMFYKG